MQSGEIEQVEERRHRKHGPACPDEAEDRADSKPDDEGFDDDHDGGTFHAVESGMAPDDLTSVRVRGTDPMADGWSRDREPSSLGVHEVVINVHDRNVEAVE